MGILTRVTQIALLLNAVMATIAGGMFASGREPHALAEPILARRVAAAEVAGAFIMVFAARRIARDASIIIPPMAFVFFAVAASAYEFFVRGNANDLPPMIVEGIFLAIYAVFAAKRFSSASAG